MSYSPHGAYLESRVLNASPIELIRMLYEAGLDSVRQAREHLNTGDIQSRSDAISKALNILAELNISLNFEAGGEIATRLSGLYLYMQQRLLEASLHQTDEPLAETWNLLSTIAEAWNLAHPPEPPAPDPAAPDPAYAGEESPARPARDWSV
ncbi:MAG: flagellar export chaperone FliS [Acidobacteria bacterium]|nr:flagellar export chaperone FliS [Acidobacteriota bacterium]